MEITDAHLAIACKVYENRRVGEYTLTSDLRVAERVFRQTGMALNRLGPEFRITARELLREANDASSALEFRDRDRY